MQAVVVDAQGQPQPVEIPEPEGHGELMPVRACGLCGSDVEKLRPEHAGAVLGHEVVCELDGRMVALVHHLPCGECPRCAAGHESTCERFAEPTIVPGGFAERVRARAWVEIGDRLDAATATYVEPLGCVLRGAHTVPRGRVLVVGLGFVGRLFRAVLRSRGDEVFGIDVDPRRDGRHPDGPVDAAVVCAPGGGAAAVEAVDPGGTVLAFAPAGLLDLDAVYRREVQIVGSRSATPARMEEASRLLPALDVPEPTVLPLERFAEGLDLYRRGEALKIVFRP